MNRSNYECYPNPDGTRGWTWNPITGSLGDCPNPNARKLANGRLKSRYLANDNLAGGYRLARGVLKDGAIPPNLDPFYPRFWEDRYAELVPRIAGKHYGRKGIFLNDMSDWIGIGVPEEWTQKMITVMKLYPEYRFYTLTKQPQNLIKFQFPDNCWVGVTATNEDVFQQSLFCLADIVASKRYISFEPLLERIALNDEDLELLDWVIIGAQTKPYKPPKIEWVEEIVRAADKAGVKVFLKNNLGHSLQYGRNLTLTHRPDEHGVLVLRQEMPR